MINGCYSSGHTPLLVPELCCEWDETTNLARAVSMINLDEHSRQIADRLSESLAELEAQSTGISMDAARRAIREVWLKVVDDIEQGRADVSSRYLAEVHGRLISVAGLLDDSGFAEYGLPLLPGGSQTSWNQFVKDCRLNEPDGTEEYALAQLRWGGHVQTFPLTLGWFALNIVRLRGDQAAVYPPRSDHDRFLGSLKDAGPDSYDAETGLRGLAAVYAEMQRSEGGADGSPTDC